MLRRRFTEEPMSRLAVWSRRLALFALAVAALSVIIVRSGLLEIEPALATFGAALVFAALAILLAFGAFVVDLAAGPAAGIGRAFSGLVIGCALLAYPGLSRLPRLQAAGDLRHHHRSGQSAALRRAGAPAAARQQSTIPARYRAAAARGLSRHRAAASVTRRRKLAYDIALAVITKRKWRVVDARPPAPARRDGVIEAVARTPIMGFRDDVVDPRQRRSATARASTCARPRATAATTSAPMPRASQACSTTSTTRAGDAPEPEPRSQRRQKKPPQPQARRRNSVSRAKPINAVDRRRAVGRDDAARHQILQMRQHRQAGGAGQPRIDADIDRAHDGRDVGLALAEPVQDRGLARLAMQDVVVDEARRVGDRRAVAGEIDRLAALGELVAARPCSRSWRRRAARRSRSPRP